MAVAIRMPDLGTTVEECAIQTWRVREGDAVAVGDIIADIETDKAVTELECTTAGVVLAIRIAAGEMAHTGDILAYVGVAGETVALDSPASVAEVPASLPPVPTAARTPMQIAPVVRNLAAKLGIDLAALRGSGANGVITREDVLRAAQTPPVAAAELKLSRNQAAVARAVAQSWSEIPHAFFTVEIDMTDAQARHAHGKANGAPISYDAMALYAMARAVVAMPSVATRLESERLIPAQGIHLALAVEVNGELLLPVIRDADRLTLPELQEEITGLAREISAGKLPPARLSGACMALSNLGMYPLESFEPIIFPGHSAMLALGAIRPSPVVLDGQVAVRPLMKATLAVDHRLMNGRAAAAFLTAIKTHLETGLLEGE